MERDQDPSTEHFVTVDNVEALKQELSKIHQEAFESILSYNRRFCELAYEAYSLPAGGQSRPREGCSRALCWLSNNHNKDRYELRIKLCFNLWKIYALHFYNWNHFNHVIQ